MSASSYTPNNTGEIMSTLSATVQHDGQELRGEYMTIKSTFLGREDHGFLTFNLNCEGANSGIVVGGYALDSAPVTPGGRRVPTAQGMALVYKVIATACVDSWEKLPNTKVLVLFDSDRRCVGFANPDTGKVLVFGEFLGSHRA